MTKIILKRLYPYLQKYWARFVHAGLSMVAVALLSTLTVWVARSLIDDALIAKNWHMLLWVTLAMPVLYIVKGIFTYTQNYTMQYISQSIVRDIRQDLYTHLQKLPVEFYHKNATGHLMSTLTGDVGTLQNSITSVPVQVIRDGLSIVFLMGTIFYLHWKFALFTLIILPLAAGPIAVLARKMRRSGHLVQTRLAEVYAALQETISGHVITKIFGKEQHEIDRFKKRNDAYLSESMRFVRADVLGSPLMEFLGSIAAALLLWYGGRDVLNGVWTTGSFFSFLGASVSAYKPIKEFAGVNARIQQGVVCAERIFKLLDEPITVQDALDAKNAATLDQTITFEDVSFSYHALGSVQHKWVLKNINLQVRKGEIVALVGSSGSGKSTLVQLIPRLFDPIHGRILLDGVDIKSLTLQSLRAQVGMVTQETILFNDTVSYNLKYGVLQGEVSIGQVQDAARIANAHDFISAMAHGYDTVIGERGVRLSGGQRQRLAIARAMLKNPPILILDEATSALDNESERLVQQALERLMEHRTVFVVAHRLSTVRRADRILVLDHGQIVEQGRHEDLLQNSTIYQKLYKTEIHN